MNQELKNNIGQPPIASSPLDIHTMPQKFMKSDGAGRRAKIVGLIIIVSVLGVALTAAAFYLNYALQNSKTKVPAKTSPVSPNNVNTNQLSQKPANQNINRPLANEDTNANQNEAVNNNVNSNPPLTNENKSTTMSAGLDSDNDGLTDKEEELYGTDINQPDTDGDGYLDGAEVANLYNPKGSGRLISSASVDVFVSSAFDYSVIYPISWTLEVQETTGQEVSFTSQTGDFVKIFVQANPQQLPALVWYLAQWPNLSANQLKQIEVGGLKGVWGLDDLTVYFAVGDQLYVITYNIGDRTSADFQTTFQMLVKSFELRAD